MKNFNKVLISLIVCVLSLFFIGQVKADFTTLNRFPTCTSEGYSTSLGKTPHDYFCELKDTAGKQVYCLEISKTIAASSTYKYVDTIETKGQACAVLNAMKEGYIDKPESDGTFRYQNLPLDKYYKLQEKVWFWEPYPNITDENCISVETTTNSTVANLGVSSTNITMKKQTVAGKVYYVGTINLNPTDNIVSYNVTTSNEDLIVSPYLNGQNTLTFDGSAKTIYVKIPILDIKNTNRNFNVSITATYKTGETITITPFVERFKYSDNTQLLGIIGVKRKTETTTKQTSASVNLTAPLSSSGTSGGSTIPEEQSVLVAITKVDESTGKTLAGAKLQLLDENKKVIEEWISNDEVYYIQLENKGLYYLKEVYAPEGYELNDNLISFEVENFDKEIEIVMKNVPVVEVPDTGLSKTALMVLGALISLAGIGLIIYGIIKIKNSEA
ncbi:MAG: hypothetical protein E7174_01990 [Firmicutes bacterium]|nr:hypothetical protein [Bacillota bacterium]